MVDTFTQCAQGMALSQRIFLLLQLTQERARSLGLLDPPPVPPRTALGTDVVAIMKGRVHRGAREKEDDVVYRAQARQTSPDCNLSDKSALATDSQVGRTRRLLLSPSLLLEMGR